MGPIVDEAVVHSNVSLLLCLRIRDPELDCHECIASGLRQPQDEDSAHRILQERCEKATVSCRKTRKSLERGSSIPTRNYLNFFR